MRIFRVLALVAGGCLAGMPALAATFHITTSSEITSENTTLSALDAMIEVDFGATGSDSTSASITTIVQDNGNGSITESLTRDITVTLGAESLVGSAVFRFATYNNTQPGAVTGATAFLSLTSSDAFEFSFGTFRLLPGLMATTSCSGCILGDSVSRPFVSLSATLDPPQVVPLPAGLPLLVVGLGAFSLLRRSAIRRA